VSQTYELMITSLPLRHPASLLLLYQATFWLCAAEIGDYDPVEHLVDYVSQFRLLPKQTSRHEQRIAELHKTLASVTYFLILLTT